MHRLYWVVGAVLFVALAMMPAGSADPPKGYYIPPDIQAILAKKKRHEALTMDDIKKLQDWAAGVQAHLPTPPLPPGTPGAPAQPPDAAPIPVRFELTAHYTRTQGSTTQTFDVTESAPLALIAKVNGTGDYVKGILDPSAKISSFLFQPASGSGSGHYRVHATQPRGTIDFDSALTDVSGGLMLVTVGGDTLGIISGQMLGSVDSTYHNVDDGKASTKPYKGAVRESLVDLLFPWEAHVTKDRTKPVPNPRAQISYRTLVAALQSGKSTPITVNESFDWDDHGEKVAGTVELTITVRPPQVEARLVADTDWRSWIPEGPTPAQSEGNTFRVHLELVDGVTGKPTKANVQSASYMLANVSHLPGVCGNWPAPGAKNYDAADLYFDASKNPAPPADRDGQKLDLDARHFAEKVTISSRDFAAKGDVLAVVWIDGNKLVAHFSGAHDDTFLPLPKDDDHDGIADAWTPASGHAATDDDEDTPALGSKGDGYTVFDEYRGLLVSPGHHKIPATDEEHLRLDPNQRELAIVLDVPTGGHEEAIRRGIGDFSAAIGNLHLIYIGNVDRLSKLPATADGSDVKRGALPNASPKNLTTAIWVTTARPTDKSLAVATSIPTHPCPDDTPVAFLPLRCFHDPSLIDWVRVIPGNVLKGTLLFPSFIWDSTAKAGTRTQAYFEEVRKLLDAQGVDAAVRAKQLDSLRRNAALIDGVIEFAVMHELGHAVGMLHHGEDDPVLRKDTNYETTGDRDCPMHYWQFIDHDPDPREPGKLRPNEKAWAELFAGTWNPAEESSQHHPWKFCKDNLKQAHLRP